MGKKHLQSRRKFLGSLPCLALGSTTLYSSLINLKAMNTLMGSTSVDGGYKALVCILLSGGNDSFNMIVPRDGEAYDQYASSRSNLAHAKTDLLAINPDQGDGRDFGLHPQLTNLQLLFNQGNLAFVNNVGTLIEPTDQAGIINGSAKLPLGLLSHSDQVMHWQTAFPQERLTTGWGGRMADLLQAQNGSETVSMNISLGGNNLYQRGEAVVPYAINDDGGVAIIGYNNPEPFFNLITEDVNSMVNKQYEDLFKDSYAGTLKRSIESNETFNTAVAAYEMLPHTFTSTGRFSNELQMVARSMLARTDLDMNRQIFFVDIGGFDNHDELLGNHGDLMQQLDAGLGDFYSFLEVAGLTDCVTTFTISDFSRTLTSNGNGTDHGWGGNALVMGGAVRGKRLYGDYPELVLGSSLDIGGGVFIPTTAADQYFAELALWFGISPNDLSQILPNIGNFYSVSSGQAPLGFLL